jgi:hypothetical protein
MKIAAMDAIENSKPSDLRFGTVTSVTPLKVMITNDFIIPESLLVVPKHLTDYSVVTNVGGSGDEVQGGSQQPTSSVEMYVEGETLMINTNIGGVETFALTDEDEEVDGVDDRTLTIYNGLEVGDQVVLLRNQGGTSYLILDRI